jgi:hypothetical protein
MQERRLYPRYPAEWSVRLTRDAAEWHDTETRSVSVAGLAMSVSRTAVETLSDKGHLLTPGDSIQLQFVAGRGGPAIEARVGCLIKQVRRVSQAEYIVGAEFTGLSSIQVRQIELAVDQLARQRRR